LTVPSSSLLPNSVVHVEGSFGVSFASLADLQLFIENADVQPVLQRVVATTAGAEPEMVTILSVESARRLRRGLSSALQANIKYRIVVPFDASPKPADVAPSSHEDVASTLAKALYAAPPEAWSKSLSEELHQQGLTSLSNSAIVVSVLPVTISHAGPLTDANSTSLHVIFNPRINLPFSDVAIDDDFSKIVSSTSTTSTTAQITTPMTDIGEPEWFDKDQKDQGALCRPCGLMVFLSLLQLLTL